MPPVSCRDERIQSVDAGNDAVLLEAALREARLIARGITHDLNSALQCMGDALFAIRDDAENGGGGDRPSAEPSALALADDALRRLTAIVSTIPGLVPRSFEDDAPIVLEDELLDLVALTRHYWRKRARLVVDVDPGVSPFRCAWWVARLAALRLVLATIEAQQTGNTAHRQELPRVRISAAQTGDTLELRAVGDRIADDDHADGTERERDAVDSTLELCANRLGGETWVATNSAGAAERVIRFPVRFATSADLDAVLR